MTLNPACDEWVFLFLAPSLTTHLPVISNQAHLSDIKSLLRLLRDTQYVNVPHVSLMKIIQLVSYVCLSAGVT